MKINQKGRETLQFDAEGILHHSRMWKGLQHITEYRQKSHGATINNATLPDRLNEFYARFEALNIRHQQRCKTSIWT